MAANEAQAPAKKDGVFHRLYVGTGAFDVVGKRKRWYIFFALLILVCLGSIVFRGFNLGIDFKGGTRISLPAQGADGDISTTQVTDVFNDTLGKEPAAVQTVGTGDAATIQIRSETLNTDEVTDAQGGAVRAVPAGERGRAAERAVHQRQRGERVVGWGDLPAGADRARRVPRARDDLPRVVLREDGWPSSALAALIHDILVTAGVYSIVGFEVTPATVIGLLTILGFSLYDTVVVFDKIKENTRGLLGLTRRTYAEAANLALNQTLMRSINTSLIAVLPVIGLLVVGVGLLGVGTLQDLALVQLTGIIAGALSSIALATPMLVDLKMREPKFQQQARRVHGAAGEPGPQGGGARRVRGAGRGGRRRSTTTTCRPPTTSRWTRSCGRSGPWRRRTASRPATRSRQRRRGATGSRVASTRVGRPASDVAELADLDGRAAPWFARSRTSPRQGCCSGT